MEQLANLNSYLANLYVVNVKLHNLHWFVKGIKFRQIHVFTEQLYDKFFTDFDDVAEIMIMHGARPVSTIKEYLKLATLQEINQDNYSTKAVLTILKDDLTLLRQQALDIRNASDEANDFTVANLLEDQIAYYDKQLWFLTAMSS